MKYLRQSAALLWACCAASSALADAPAGVDVYLRGKLLEQVSFTAPVYARRFWLNESPDTLVELRLVAPQPLIFEVKEFDESGRDVTATARVRLPVSGDALAASELNGQPLRNDFRFVRTQ